LVLSQVVNPIASESKSTTVLNRPEKGNKAGIKQTWLQSHCECERDGGVGK